MRYPVIGSSQSSQNQGCVQGRQGNLGSQRFSPTFRDGSWGIRAASLPVAKDEIKGLPPATSTSWALPPSLLTSAGEPKQHGQLLRAAGMIGCLSSWDAC